jgi:excisionase family DNA binding protein
MTLNDAARTLGVSPATLRHQIANGRLAAQKVGRDWSVGEDEVRRYAALSLGKPGRRPREQLTLGLVDTAARQET